MDIGEVIRLSGLPASTLHVWEKKGLIACSGREGLRRQYDEDILERLAVIVICQEAAFTIEEIKAVLEPGALEGNRELLTRKRAALAVERARLDDAIAGIDHAIRCAEPTPLQCPNFKSKLQGVLPVRRLRARSRGSTGEG